MCFPSFYACETVLTYTVHYHNQTLTLKQNAACVKSELNQMLKTGRTGVMIGHSWVICVKRGLGAAGDPIKVKCHQQHVLPRSHTLQRALIPLTDSLTSHGN